ncbi:MAG TPA: phosphatase PAP2 family protein [Alphaproteobacteria bacterium]|nr:phosphatase PAP2 family protein [Alphaproteobacteria bacterium]
MPNGSGMMADRLYRWLKTHLNRSEVLLLLALFVPTALVLCFGSLADEMLEGDTMRFDKGILLALRSPTDTADPIGPRWVETMFTDITSLGSTTVLAFITLAAVVYLLLARKRGSAWLVLAAVSGGTLISTVLKNLFDRPRPDFVAHIVETTTASFPSGHAMLSAVTYLTLGVLLARVESSYRLRLFIMGLALLCTVAVGFSRVYLGVHYPTDVLAGWALGAAWAMLCWVVALWLQRRGSLKGDRK